MVVPRINAGFFVLENHLCQTGFPFYRFGDPDNSTNRFVQTELRKSINDIAFIPYFFSDEIKSFITVISDEIHQQGVVFPEYLSFIRTG
jgi:hypothetical protein